MTLNFTYDELADRLGITRNAARVLAQRRKWSRYTSQEDGRARVRVPADELERMGARRGGEDAPHVPPHDVHPTGGEIAALREHVQDLRNQLQKAEDRAERAEQRAERIEAELREAWADTAAAHRHAEEAHRLIAGLNEKIEALKERERLAVELEAQRRPWWRRFMSR